MKFCDIGVYHHDCWFTDGITQFPELQVKEISERIYPQNSDKRIVSAVYRIESSESEKINEFVNHVRFAGKISTIKQLGTGKTAFIQVAWRAPVTSYDAVLKSGCVVTSPCQSRDGYEAYSIISEEPNQIKKLLYELEQIGDVKLFSIKNDFSKKGRHGLTDKQKQAVSAAISMGYYSWPKKVNLEELAAKLGIKRRTLQENLRKAEAKILPSLIDQLTEEK
ncbi:helix-turn-helix domain-containing protein [Candidatus Micrarchaeota archaeon]|nr:helix-turn-helix domain-containing protein [Candidatus Micrarchaeota archaeon]